MGDIKFSCPECGQHITCDQLWMGQQLPCPTCQTNLIVPQTQPPAVAPSIAIAPPPPSAPTKLSIGNPPSSKPAGAPSMAPPPPRTAPVYRSIQPAQGKKSGGPMKYVAIAAVVMVCAVGGYFGFGALIKAQDKMNEKRRAIEKDADGGEVGHIADLYQVLDATDTDSESFGMPSGPRSRYSEMDFDDDDGPARSRPRPEDNLPIIPSTHALELTAAKIPEGRANGMIGGTNFLVQMARLDVTPTASVLRLTQGSIAAPERELLIYLRPKPEGFGGSSLTISPDMKGSGVPNIVKRWKTNPRYAPQSKSFPNGYALKLELDRIEDGEFTGKIYLALPDTEQSFVAGIFRAETNLPDSPATGGNNAIPPAAASALDARYGNQK